MELFSSSGHGRDFEERVSNKKISVEEASRAKLVEMIVAEVKRQLS